MNIISKVLLLVNTIKYLKCTQIFNQILLRFIPKKNFYDNKKKNYNLKEYSLWIDGLDNNDIYINRFNPSELLHNKLFILNETRDFDTWFFSDANHLWNFNVHYLEYLVPLYSLWRKNGDDNYKKKINDIFLSWYTRGCFEADSNQAYTISLRIVNQLIISESISDKQKLFDSIYLQYRYLIKHQEKHILGNHYLENLKTIVICSLVFSENDVYEIFIKKLLDELKEQIADDGLHFELSLMYHKIILEDLIRVAVVLKQAGKNEYINIVSYISRMITALYSLEFGMNRTPLFNDAGDNVAKPTQALINTCRQLFEIEPKNENYISGYYKLYDEKITVLFDCGKLSPSYMPGHSHCDCLSFELFYDKKPIFVNSGTYQYQGEKRRYFRSTSAHNSVVINGHEQSELWGEHRAGRRIYNVSSKQIDNTVIGKCNNYFGEQHIRQLALDGGILEVNDKTTGCGNSYLHLAPGLRYEAGNIVGSNIGIKLTLINCELNIQKMLYSECFGKIEEIECLVFSWSEDNEYHGYKVSFEQ